MGMKLRFPLMAVLGLWLAWPAAAHADSCPGGVPDEIYTAYVRTAQLELDMHGYDAGTPDGHMTPKTEAAVRDYQTDAKLPIGGCVTKTLLDHLQFVLPRVEKAPGTGNPQVLEVQKLLTRRGYYMGAVDGKGGSRTRAAMRQFQQDAKLPFTNVIDQSLIDSIKAADPGIRGDKAFGDKGGGDTGGKSSTPAQ